MSVCRNLKIECGIGCGRVLERCDITRHHVLCPLRTQASKAERVIKFRQEHTDGEMTYPKKEVLDDPTGCLIGRHMVEQQDIHLFKCEVKRLREKSEREELETSRKIQCLTRNGEKFTMEGVEVVFTFCDGDGHNPHSITHTRRLIR